MSVRHRRNMRLARCAPDVHTFWPVMMISSPLMTPRVSTAARSEPWFGSEKPWQYTSSPEMIPGRETARGGGWRGERAPPRRGGRVHDGGRPEGPPPRAAMPPRHACPVELLVEHG